MSIDVREVQLLDLDESRELLQSGFWGAFRQRHGWRARAFRCRYRERDFSLLVLLRRLAPGIQLAYAPHGPQLIEPPADRERFLLDLAAALRPYLRPCLFLRFDLPWTQPGLGNLPPRLHDSRRLYKAVMDIQPSSTVILDLEPDEDDLLAAMKSKTRYNIRLCAKKNVQIEVLPSNSVPAERLERALSEWYRLYRETARRDRITLHRDSYYRTLFSLAAGYGPSAPELYLLNARHEGQLLAGIIVAVKGEGAWYLYGASSEQKRNLMPSYGLQWRAIQLARQRGCRSYDLFGIPPDSDPRHPMHGLFRFKTGFGGQVLNRPGCYDLCFRVLPYRLYRLAERLRNAYFRRWRKRLVRR